MLKLVIEPVVDELDAVFVLDPEILHVDGGDVGRGDSLELVTVHEVRHMPNSMAASGRPRK